MHTYIGDDGPASDQPAALHHRVPTLDGPRQVRQEDEQESGQCDRPLGGEIMPVLYTTCDTDMYVHSNMFIVYNQVYTHAYIHPYTYLYTRLIYTLNLT